MREFIYNPILPIYKFPVGACKVFENITINVKVRNDIYIQSLKLIIKNDNEPIYKMIDCFYTHHEEQYHNFCCTFQVLDVGIYWYYFEVDNGNYFLGPDECLEAIKTNNPACWLLSIHQDFVSSLSWYKGRIMYQIFVDRFYKGGNNPPKQDIILHKSWDEDVYYKPIDGKILNNDFFGGDLKGIIHKLDYLKSLNVGLIYLSPIFEAQSNHKYDTGDYFKIDSMFGTLDDFKELINEAQKRDIYIILDGVFNHTGDNSRYFNKYGKYDSVGAYQSQESPYYHWYSFINWPYEYDCWWGFSTLPSVNQRNYEVLEFFTGPNGVINYWLSFGARGFRLDVVDELNDNFVNLIHDAIKRVNKENIVIGEVWEDASIKISYNQRRRYFNGRQLDTVMNYPLKRAILSYIRDNNWRYLQIKIRKLLNNYPKHTINTLMNHLGTHDTMRLLNNFAYSREEDLSKDQQAHYIMRDEELQQAIMKLKLAITLQFMLPGVPCIYYGDEIGMQGFRDPFCRRTFRWHNINEDIFKWYQLLSNIRISHDCFKDGTYEEAYINDNIFSFFRHGKDYRILVIVNNNDYDFIYNISYGLDLINNEEVKQKVIVKGKSVKIIKITK